MNKTYVVGAVGVATSAFGFFAWTSYLFAGTGAAKLICFSLIILGAIIAFIGGSLGKGDATHVAEKTEAETTGVNPVDYLVAGASLALTLVAGYCFLKGFLWLFSPDAMAFLKIIVFRLVVSGLMLALGLYSFVSTYKAIVKNKLAD